MGVRDLRHRVTLDGGGGARAHFRRTDADESQKILTWVDRQLWAYVAA